MAALYSKISILHLRRRKSLQFAIVFWYNLLQGTFHLPFVTYRIDGRVRKYRKWLYFFTRFQLRKSYIHETLLVISPNKVLKNIFIWLCHQHCCDGVNYFIQDQQNFGEFESPSKIFMNEICSNHFTFRKIIHWKGILGDVSVLIITW